MSLQTCLVVALCFAAMCLTANAVEVDDVAFTRCVSACALAGWKKGFRECDATTVEGGDAECLACYTTCNQVTGAIFATFCCQP
jgi:hypothetical protein